jgi:deoxyribodipyrimidine photo-lyase
VTGGSTRGAGGTIVWFRQDLRLQDNPALHAAVRTGRPVIPVYVWSPGEEGAWPPGSASRWWLHHSLTALDQELRRLGSRLIIQRGKAAAVLGRVAATTGAGAVVWNRRYEPAALECSSAVSDRLRRDGMQVEEFNGALLADPQHFCNRSGKPYQVFTAFQRGLLQQLHPAAAVPRPRRLRAPTRWPRALVIGQLGLIPRIRWYEAMEKAWQPGERGAHLALQRFRRQAIEAYRHQHDIPGVRGTSELSPHLHFGEIGPRQIWHALGPRGRGSPFFRQIIWREFANHLLFHFPHTPTEPLRPEFRAFRWRRDAPALRRWQRGQTGVPLVDAGMRQLWTRGWMHNRVRLVAGSFLVKNLLIPWQDGARWFWDTLVDADLANNTLNWQWVAGCGADAAPYFRIFNPETQARRFDREQRYVRQWVPQIAAGSGYPSPMVDLGATRVRALEAYSQMRNAARSQRRSQR